MMRSNLSSWALTALAFSAFWILATPRLALADDAGTNRTIRVQGVGTVDATPDQAVILATVVKQDARAETALTTNSEAMRRILEKLREFSIAESDIQTRGFSVTPLYERRDRGTATPRIIGYRAVNGIEVKVRVLSRLGAMLDALIVAGADHLDGVRFSIAEPEPLADKARLLAIADARRKAELYAKAAGAAVGRVIGIAEEGLRVPAPRMLQAAEMSARAVPVAPGEQRVSARVTVVYELR